MKFKSENCCRSYAVSFMILLMFLIIESCSFNNNDSHNDMKTMNMKKENNAEHDTMHHNMEGMEGMEGMDMSSQNMDYISKADSIQPINDSLKRSSLIMSQNYRVISSQKSIKQVQKTKMNELKAQGYISIDERRNNKISSRISGRIEKLFIKYNFQYVKKGEKIMEVYSPELNTYQEELLFLMKENNNGDLADKAEEKIRLLGVSQSQINVIKKTGTILPTIDIYSPREGFVFFKQSAGMSLKNTNTVSESKMKGMGNASNLNNNIVSSEGQIREGNYINKGDILFWINDLEAVWAIIAIDNIHLEELKIGLTVTLIIELNKNDTIKAIINFIEPGYQQNQKFIMSRIYLKNFNQKYKIGSLVEGIVNTGIVTSNVVPYRSVLFLGKRKIVWVLKEKTAGNNKVFEVREVMIGKIMNGEVEIKKGLTKDEEIATDAGYLIDRESLIEPE